MRRNCDNEDRQGNFGHLAQAQNTRSRLDKWIKGKQVGFTHENSVCCVRLKSCQTSVTSGSFQVGQGSEIVHTAGPVHKANLGWEVIRVTVNSGEDDSLGKSRRGFRFPPQACLARPVVIIVIDHEPATSVMGAVSSTVCGLEIRHFEGLDDY